MLIINSKFPKPKYVYGGSGFFDIAKNLLQKTANSRIGKKVLNPTTATNLKKAVNSPLGQEIKNSVLTGVTEATKNLVSDYVEKERLPVSKKRIKKRIPSKSKKRKGNEIEEGTGVFDLAKNFLQKTANSSIGKKIVNSATTANLQKVVNSPLGQELKNSVLTGVTEATKNIVTDSFEHLGLPVSKKRRKKRIPSKAKRRKGSGVIWE